MTRPRCHFRVCYCPPAREFRPAGMVDCGQVEITRAEAEALRLKNLKGLDQTEAAKRMGVSQSTFQRVLTSAYHKVSEAVVLGKALCIVDHPKDQGSTQKPLSKTSP